jgi:hypothetical protein
MNTKLFNRLILAGLLATSSAFGAQQHPEVPALHINQDLIDQLREIQVEMQSAPAELYAELAQQSNNILEQIKQENDATKEEILENIIYREQLAERIRRQSQAGLTQQQREAAEMDEFEQHLAELEEAEKN